jgi:glycosyltransferase involved in cell wall biosynthesis
LRNKEPILLHLHGLYNLNTYSIALSLGGRIPIAAQSHDALPPGPAKLRRIQNVLRKYALSKIDRFFLPTQAQSQLFSEICTSRRKIRIIPLPVDLKQFHRIEKETARRKISWRPKGSYLLFVGRADERKGLRYLIEAQRILLSGFPNLQVMVAGSNPPQQKIWNNVTFLGPIRYSELPLYYSAADICVQPSLGESWGRAIIESLGCQTPVIATDTGCVQTLKEENIQGLLTVPMRNSTELANTISRTLPNAHAMGRRIDRTKLERYDSTNFVKEMIHNYKELASMYY